MGKVIEKGITNKETCQDFFTIRSWVAKQSWATMREEGVPWKTAISRAWDQAKQHCQKEFGVIV